jgi:tetratricopeptide (TPR) repeat protein
MLRSLIFRLSVLGVLGVVLTFVVSLEPSTATGSNEALSKPSEQDTKSEQTTRPEQSTKSNPPAEKPADQWNADEESAERAFLEAHYTEAERLWAVALADAAKIGPEDLKVAQTLNQMTHLFIHEGRLKEAEPLLKRALSIREKSLGKDNILTAETLGNLALIEKRLGHDAEAEKLYLEVLDIKEHKLGDSSPSVAITKTNLANLYAEMHKCLEAKKLYQEALAIDEKAYGTNHEEVANDCLNIGALLYHCGQPEEALSYLIQASKIEPASNSAKIPILHYIGLCHAKLKNLDKAEACYKQALQLHETVKGKGHPDGMVHLFNLARAIDEQGRTEEAEHLYKGALATAEGNKQSAALSNSSTERGGSMAIAPGDGKNSIEAGSTYSPYKCAECCIEIAHFYHRHQKFEEAEKYYKEALEFYDKLSNEERRKLYELPRAYADLLRELKREKESDAMARRYLDVFDEKTGEQVK